MESMPVEGLTLFFDADEREAAELVRRACEKSARLIRECWNLDTPEDLRVYVLTSAWLRSTFHSAPWGWRILMGAALPFWYFRARRLWQVAGGWQQQYGRRRTVGIKTPRLLSQGDSGLGDRIFILERDRASQVQRITCHELVHAYTAHLKLPAWLHEGLAMLTVDRFFERPTSFILPFMLVSPIAGAMVDRYNQKLMMMVSDLGAVTALEGWWATGRVRAWRCNSSLQVWRTPLWC